MLQSIGDFVINIIPEINKKNLIEGVNFLGNLGNTTKLLDFGKNVTKGMYDIFGQTVETMGELQRFADSVGVPVEKVDRLRKAFLQAGAGAETANDSIKTIIKSVQGFYYGEGDFEKLGKAGILPSMFSGDAFKDIEMLANKFSKMSAAQRQYFVDATGMNEDSIKYLQLDYNKRRDILALVDEIGVMHKKQGEQAIEYLKTLQQIASTWEQIKVSIATPLLTDVNKILGDIGSVMLGREGAGKSLFSDLLTSGRKFASAELGAGASFVKGAFPALSSAMSLAAGAVAPSASNINININATGMGSDEAAQKISEQVKSALKDSYKDQINAQQKTNKVN